MTTLKPFTLRRGSSAFRLALFAFGLLLSTALPAQVAADQEKKSIDVGAGEALSTLKELSGQVGGKLLYANDAVAGVRTRAVKGEMSASEALARMLADTGLIAVRDETTGAIVVRKESDAEKNGVRAAQASVRPKSPSPVSSTAPDDTEVIVLSPFVVDASQDRGYAATSTLAGTRIRTNLADVGSAISVLTKELITDLGGYNNQTVLGYAVNTEVSGARGNFSGANRNGTEGHPTEGANFTNPNGNTRVRGLVAADNTRDFFLSDVPWDGYNISRVDLQRGPNAILFGLGSPAGVINASSNPATFQNKGSVEATVDEFGTQRYVFDYNRNVIDHQLGVRVSLLDNDQRFQQKEAWSHDRRVYAAFKYDPAFLNKHGTLFELSGNFEHGEITSNNPRYVPPEDYLTPFWAPVKLGGVAKHTFNVNKDTFPAGSTYQPVVGGVYAMLYQYANAGSVDGFGIFRVPTYGARRPDGTIIKTTSDDSGGPARSWNSEWMYLNNVPAWASQRGLPYAGIGAYRSNSITDPSIFDFYHHLIDGPNKGEWNKWNQFTLDLQNTFFDNMVGYDVTLHRQFQHSGSWAAAGWEGNAIYMDINERMYDGTPNPNVGRAYVAARTINEANNLNKSNRDAFRAQVFGDYDFATKHNGWWAKILGDQRVTGMYTDEDNKTDGRSLILADWSDLETRTRFSSNPMFNGTDAQAYGQQGYRYYVSGDLRSASAPTNLGISGANMSFLNFQGGPTQYKYFDTAWTATGVDPGAAWVNPNDPDNVNHSVYYQSNNPANYKGWSTATGNYVTMFSNQTIQGMSAQDYLTNSGTLTDFEVRSKVGVWQGTFWNHSIVGIYGIRQDDSRQYQYITSDRTVTHNVNPLTGGADLRPGTYNYDNPEGSIATVTTHTKNWSLMAHLNQFIPGHDYLPINVRLYYNKGENFQPLAGRIDAFGHALPSPGGTTTDKSIMLSTKDDKYSLRFTKYETAVQNASSTDGQIGGLWALEQVLSGAPNYVRGYLRGEYSYEDYGAAVSEDPVVRAQAIDKFKNSIVPAWMQFEKDLKARYPDFVKIWFGGNTTFGTDNLTALVTDAAPSGMTFTEDSVSRGYELEFTGNPTNNWRITANASKTEASRTNVPGAAFRDVATYVDNAIQTTDAGLAPIWWATNTYATNGGTRGFGPWPWYFRPEWLKVNALNGQSAGEIRKYRANLVTNYTFDHGILKGVGVGGGYRWEDKSVIGYAPLKNADDSLTVNINAPYYAPREENIDLWVSYSRKLSHGVNWRIQLNVYNVGGRNKLVPIAVGVDPVWAANTLDSGTAIGPNTVVPMVPTTFSIREGMAFQLSNTFEF